MNRRLYFLSPDVTHAEEVVKEALLMGVRKDHVHTMARNGVDLQDLPQATSRQKRDTMHIIGDWLWKINLGVFFIALLTLVLTLNNPSVLTALMLVIMVVTFINGYFWSRVPDTHLSEFRAAMAHGEVLIMIDVPEQDLSKVESRLHQRHPQAIEGGTSWSVAALDL